MNLKYIHNKNNRKIISILIIVMLSLTFFTLFTMETKADEDPDDFFLWVNADSHYDTSNYWDSDISVSSGVYSGVMIQEGVDRIDLGIHCGDIDLTGASSYSSFLNSTFSCLVDGDMQTNFWDLPADERAYAFCMGNHEADGGQSLTTVAKGLGLDPSENWYNNSVTMGDSYNYTIQRGNLLFVMMGGNRNYPNDYNYSIENPGDFYWLEDLTIWANANDVNILISTHYTLWNGSSARMTGLSDGQITDTYYDVSGGDWDTYSPGNLKAGFRDPWWDGVTVGWNASARLWDLINTSGCINFWFAGHMHSRPDSSEPPYYEHMGWDDVRGTDRQVQKGPNCTHIQVNAIAPYSDSSKSYSRVLKFTNNSKDVKIMSFDHVANDYMHDTGWQSSAQNITITDALKYPYDPTFGASSPPGGDSIVFTDINGQANDTPLYEDERYFNWTKINDTVYYQLMIANESGGLPDWNDLIVNLTDINEANYGVYYSEDATTVYFILPDAYEFSFAGSQYYRVQACTSEV